MPLLAPLSADGIKRSYIIAASVAYFFGHRAGDKWPASVVPSPPPPPAAGCQWPLGNGVAAGQIAMGPLSAAGDAGRVSTTADRVTFCRSQSSPDETSTTADGGSGSSR